MFVYMWRLYGVSVLFKSRVKLAFFIACFGSFIYSCIFLWTVKVFQNYICKQTYTTNKSLVGKFRDLTTTVATKTISLAISWIQVAETMSFTFIVMLTSHIIFREVDLWLLVTIRSIIRFLRSAPEIIYRRTNAVRFYYIFKLC